MKTEVFLVITRYTTFQGCGCCETHDFPQVEIEVWATNEKAGKRAKEIEKNWHHLQGRLDSVDVEAQIVQV